jgi:hypothetical protein
MLFPQAGGPADLPGPWWVAHTKPRWEKALATDFAARKIPYFLPLLDKVSFSGGRKRHGLIPLFPSYLFFCGGEFERYTALTTGRLVNVIEVKDQARLVRELDATHRVLANGLRLELYPWAVVGSRVRVTAGPLQGIEGVVVSRDGRHRLVLEVNILGQGAALDIAPELLEPAEGSQSMRRAS